MESVITLARLGMRQEMLEMFDRVLEAEAHPMVKFASAMLEEMKTSARIAAWSKEGDDAMARKALESLRRTLLNVASATSSVAEKITHMLDVEGGTMPVHAAAGLTSKTIEGLEAAIKNLHKTYETLAGAADKITED